jgi:hypothetical protein
MLYAIGLQAHRESRASGTRLTQVIMVPAAGLAYSRLITQEHPRRPWKATRYSLVEPWNKSTVDAQMSRTLTDPGIINWYPTGSPMLFPITDEEYLEMADGTMPRNVPLRFQRGLEQLGKRIDPTDPGAADRAETVRLALSNDIELGIGTGLGSVPGTTVATRIENMLNTWANAIKLDETTNMAGAVPAKARARGAGKHRNGANLPKRGEEEAAVPSKPEAAPAAAPAPAPKSGACKVGERLTDHNGRPYMARPVQVGVKGMSDIELYRTVARNGGHILLEGPPGSGKTTGLFAAFPDMIYQIADPTLEATDLYGQHIPVLDADGKEILVWEHGPLTRAVLEDKPYLLDEIFLAPSAELAPLMGLMAGDKVFRVPNNPRLGDIPVGPNFRVFAAYNPSTARNISEALTSRFTLKLTVGTSYSAMRSLGCPDRIVDAALHLDRIRQAGDLSWAPQARELLRFRDDEAMLGTIYALRNLLSAVPEMEVRAVAQQLQERYGDLPQARVLIQPLAIGE